MLVRVAKLALGCADSRLAGLLRAPGALKSRMRSKEIEAAEQAPSTRPGTMTEPHETLGGCP